MLRPPKKSGPFVRLHSNASLDETIRRLEQALERLSWRITARVDGKTGAGHRAQPMSVIVIAPRTGDLSTDLTWSLLLPNEVVVYAESDGCVSVAYRDPTEAAVGDAPRHRSLGRWRSGLAEAVAFATGRHVGGPTREAYALADG